AAAMAGPSWPSWKRRQMTWRIGTGRGRGMGHSPSKGSGSGRALSVCPFLCRGKTSCRDCAAQPHVVRHFSSPSGGTACAEEATASRTGCIQPLFPTLTSPRLLRCSSAPPPGAVPLQPCHEGRVLGRLDALLQDLVPPCSVEGEDGLGVEPEAREDSRAIN